VLFGLDFAVRLMLSTDRRHFLRRHLFDLAVLVVPVLRPLRALRVVLAVLTISRRTESWARGRLAAYVSSATTLDRGARRPSLRRRTRISTQSAPRSPACGRC
jgi:voltage-gated potassium channel